jgi:hypothetical protein
MLIAGGNVHDEESDTTKTAKERTVLLSATALEALARQKGAHIPQRRACFPRPQDGRTVEVQNDH